MSSGQAHERSKPMERSASSTAEKKTFVFGSSTPRDLSYMHTVPITLRTYDSKVKPVPRAKNETLAHYMRQARSVTRNKSESRDGSSDRVTRGAFAFGSSTPRLLSHLYSDAKINPQVGRRSYTTPALPTTRSKTVPAPVKVQVTKTTKIIRKPSGTEQKQVITTTTRQVISVSQKRQPQPKEGSEEFMNSVKEKLEAQKHTPTAKPAKKGVEKKKKPKEEESVEATEEKKGAPKVKVEKSADGAPEKELGNSPEPEKNGKPHSPPATPEPEPGLELKPEPEVEESPAGVVQDDEAKALTIEATHLELILPDPVKDEEGQATTKTTARIESMEGSKMVQQMMGDDEAELKSDMAEPFHLGSIGLADISKATAALISKVAEHLDSVNGKVSTAAALKDEAISGKVTTVETSATEEQENAATTVTTTTSTDFGSSEVSGTKETQSPVVSSTTPFPNTEPVATDLSPSPDNNISGPMIAVVAAAATADKDGSVQEAKGSTQEKAEDQGTVEVAKIPEEYSASSDEHRFPVESEMIPENSQKLESAVAVAPEKPPHTLVYEEQPESAASFVYNYSYEYHYGTSESPEEPSRMDVGDDDGSGTESHKKPEDTAEGISAL